MAKKLGNPLDRMSDRALEVLTIIIVVIAVLVALVYAAIWVNPYIPLNPFPPREPATPIVAATATPGEAGPQPAGPGGTPTAQSASLPPTWTPTVTRTPTNTRTPTRTFTPTFTPTPTDTETPVPTDTPTPTETPVPPTATRRPTLPPPPPPPSPTPLPPYEFVQLLVGPNCHWFGFHGLIRGANDLPISGVTVRVWNDSGWSATATTNSDGIYQIPISGEQATGRWWLQVLYNGAPASEQLGVDMGGGCQYGIQEVKMDWRQRR